MRTPNQVFGNKVLGIVNSLGLLLHPEWDSATEERIGQLAFQAVRKAGMLNEKHLRDAEIRHYYAMLKATDEALRVNEVVSKVASAYGLSISSIRHIVES